MVKGKAFKRNDKEARKPLKRRASSRVKSRKQVPFETRQKEKRALEETRIKAAELLEARKEVRKVRAKKRAEKKRRKEENEVKAGQYQVIKNTDKIRKWHKNARKQLQKMGPEQIQKLLG